MWRAGNLTSLSLSSHTCKLGRIAPMSGTAVRTEWFKMWIGPKGHPTTQLTLYVSKRVGQINQDLHGGWIWNIRPKRRFITIEAKERALIINNIRCLKYHWAYFRNTDGQADVCCVGVCEQRVTQTVAVVFILNYTSFFLIMTFDEKWRQLYRIQILIYERCHVCISHCRIFTIKFCYVLNFTLNWECIMCFPRPHHMYLPT